MRALAREAARAAAFMRRLDAALEPARLAVAHAASEPILGGMERRLGTLVKPVDPFGGLAEVLSRVGAPTAVDESEPLASRRAADDASPRRRLSAALRPRVAHASTPPTPRFVDEPVIPLRRRGAEAGEQSPPAVDADAPHWLNERPVESKQPAPPDAAAAGRSARAAGSEWHPWRAATGAESDSPTDVAARPRIPSGVLQATDARHPNERVDASGTTRAATAASGVTLDTPGVGVGASVAERVDSISASSAAAVLAQRMSDVGVLAAYRARVIVGEESPRSAGGAGVAWRSAADRGALDPPGRSVPGATTVDPLARSDASDPVPVVRWEASPARVSPSVQQPITDRAAVLGAAIPGPGGAGREQGASGLRRLAALATHSLDDGAIDGVQRQPTEPPLASLETLLGRVLRQQALAHGIDPDGAVR